MKPYEILNVELNQRNIHGIRTVRRNDELQSLLDNRKLLIEILFQTMDVKRYDYTQCDISFTIRYHDEATKEYHDLAVVSINKFKTVTVAGIPCENPVREIFYYMTKTIPEIKNITSNQQE